MNSDAPSRESPMLRDVATRSSFRIMQRLHQSTPNASVYICQRHEQDQSDVVAVKIVHSGSNTNRSRSSIHDEAMIQEYAVATRLLNEDAVHPHVVVYHSVVSTASSQRRDTITQRKSTRESIMLVMEYCSGGDLFTHLEQQPGRRFTEAQALSIFQQVVSGVHYLHTLGIAHMDISLENVLLDAHGVAKICDFGLSIFVDASPSRTAVASDRIGKTQYMAPEVVAGEGRAYDPLRADVWSLGAMLFIMLTGSPLFLQATPTDSGWIALKRVGIAGILRSWKLDAEVSSSMITLLSRMLETDPGQRLDSHDLGLRVVALGE